MDISIAVESPLSEDIRALLRALNDVLNALSPPEFFFQMTPEEMARPDTTVFIAREGGVAIACGALRRHADGVGEVKRMYTIPSRQGRGIGGLILAERTARAEGCKRLVLETGHLHHAAWRVYERAGFVRCGAVLDYPTSDYNVFYQKPLTASAVPA